MASAKSPRKNDTHAQKLVQKTLAETQRALVFIGKPFYIALSYIVLFILTVFYITGRVSRLILIASIRGAKAVILRIWTLIDNLKNAVTISKKPSRFTKKIKLFRITSKRFSEQLFFDLVYKLIKLRYRLQDSASLLITRLSEAKKALATKSSKIVRQVKGGAATLPAKRDGFVVQLEHASENILRKLDNLKVALLRSWLALIKRVKLPRLTWRFPRINTLPFVISGFFLTILVFIVATFIVVTHNLPSPEDLTQRNIEASTKIYDRNGILLYKIYKDKNRTPVKLGELPPQVKLATLAIEDAEFYTHPGFSIKGIIRATIKNIRKGELSGGSTITQQLVKNALLTPEKTIVRKLKEIVLAVQVELTYSKDEILEMYLNEVAYGGTAYGIQEASQVYFNKNAKELTLSEAALLAGLPKSPTRYSPFGNNPELAKIRQKEVLNLMTVNGYITQDQSEEAAERKLNFSTGLTNIKAPHFVMYVREKLVETYGEELVEKGGLEVTTSLDYGIQTLAQNIVKEEVERLANLNVGNGAAVVLDPQTGEVLAMVGSKNYFDTKSDGNVNVAISPRQPGSSIKIVNYAYALSHNYTPATVIKDAPTNFNVPGQPPYAPKNYDSKFRGNLSLRSAFAESRNVPAVRVLASYGVQNMINLGKRMGITTWEDPSRFGLSLTLGGGEIKLIDLAQVYATVANYGEKPEITSILEVTDNAGKVLEKSGCNKTKSGNTLISQLDSTSVDKVYASDEAMLRNQEDKGSCRQQQVLDPRVAYLLIDILKDNQARAPAFGTNSLLVIPGHPEVAAKTGTSNDLKDNLAIGFNQDFLVAVWVGNNDSSPMARVASGVTGATPIFNRTISSLLTERESKDWNMPEGIDKVAICSLTGTLPCENCPTKVELFLEENKPQFACSPEVIKEALSEEEKKKISSNLLIYY